MSLDIQKRIEEITANYNSLGTDNFNALIMGEPSSGKTSLLRTARFPLLVDSFDPRGWIPLRKEIAEGKVFVRDWSGDDPDKPTKYNAWEMQWEKDIKEGFLREFASYSVDSSTGLLVSMSNEVCKRNGRKPGQHAQGDYLPMYRAMEHLVALTSAEPIDFYFMAHIVKDDSEQGDGMYELAVYRGLRPILLRLFSERYVLVKKNDGKDKLSYQLLTNDSGKYKAGSRLASQGVFNVWEDANIKGLLKKAGFNAEDKPLFTPKS